MTRKKKCNSNSNSFVAAAEQVAYVFSLFLNTDSDEADVTSVVTGCVAYSRLIVIIGWRRAVVVSVVRRMNEVNARLARLVPGWVTVFERVYHIGL